MQIFAMMKRLSFRKHILILYNFLSVNTIKNKLKAFFLIINVIIFKHKTDFWAKMSFLALSFLTFSGELEKIKPGG